MPSIRQLSLSDSPLGSPVAQLRVTPPELSDRFGIQWESGSDDFDDHQTTVIEVGTDGPRAALVAYAHDPDHSVLVIMSEGTDVAPALDQLLDALEIKDDDVLGREGESEPVSHADELTLLRGQVETLQNTVNTLLKMRELEAQAFPLVLSAPTFLDETRTRLDEVENAVGARLDWRGVLAA